LAQEDRQAAPSAKLSQAQHVVALEYGFTSWRVLKAQVDASSLDGRIIAAAIAGNAAELGRLLAGHPRTHAITGGEWDRPLLHLVAANGHAACVSLLLASGCDANQRDRIDRAPSVDAPTSPPSCWPPERTRPSRTTNIGPTRWAGPCT